MSSSSEQNNHFRSRLPSPILYPVQNVSGFIRAGRHRKLLGWLLAVGCWLLAVGCWLAPDDMMINFENDLIDTSISIKFKMVYNMVPYEHCMDMLEQREAGRHAGLYRTKEMRRDEGRGGVDASILKMKNMNCCTLYIGRVDQAFKKMNICDEVEDGESIWQ